VRAARSAHTRTASPLIVCLFVCFLLESGDSFARFSFHATNLRLSTFDSFEKPPIQFRGASSFPSCSFFCFFRRVFGVFFYLNIPTGLRNVDVCFVEQNRIFNELLIFFFGTFLLFLGPFFTENGKQLPCSECLLTDVPSSILIWGFVSPKTKRTIRRRNERKTFCGTCCQSCLKTRPNKMND
jgi:hypothetical protein